MGVYIRCHVIINSVACVQNHRGFDPVIVRASSTICSHYNHHTNIVASLIVYTGSIFHWYRNFQLELDR